VPYPIPTTWLSRCEAVFLPTTWLGGCELISCCPARLAAVSFVDIVVPRGGGGGLEIAGKGNVQRHMFQRKNRQRHYKVEIIQKRNATKLGKHSNFNQLFLSCTRGNAQYHIPNRREKI
jgi:hypothetical protein